MTATTPTTVLQRLQLERLLQAIARENSASPEVVDRWLHHTSTGDLFDFEDSHQISPDISQRVNVIEELMLAGRVEEARAHAEVARWSLHYVSRCIDGLVSPDEMA